MPKAAIVQTRRFPLHVHICALFALLLLLVCIALGFLNYRQTSQMIATSSERLFDRIQHDVQKDLSNTYQPIRHLLSLLSLDPATQSIDLESRLALLPSFIQALRDNPMLNSLYLGYRNGDFFMVRPLSSDTIKQRFDAPSGASYQVWSIHRDNQKVRAEYLFFDDELNEISRRERTNENYDPRERGWFKQASTEDNQITTEPYVFFSTDEVGTTLARRSGNTAVLAADLTLAALSETLATHRATPNSELVLVDAKSNVVAYPDATRLIGANGNNKTLVKARDINPLLGELLDKHFSHQVQGTVVLAKRRWAMAQRHIQEGGPQGLHLALLIPEKELLADAYQARVQGALITLVTLLLALSLSWLASHHIAKSLRKLVAEAEAIKRFDFSRPSNGRSHILEVDQLAVSMRQMKETLGRFLDIAASLSAETNFDALLKRVLDSTVTISGAQGGLIYLYDADNRYLDPKGFVLDGQVHAPEELGIKGFALSDDALPDWLHDAASGKASIAMPMDLSKSRGLQKLLSVIGSPQVQLIAAGLHNRQQETVGVLVLFQRDDKEKSECMLTPERVAFVDAVSGSAALCIDSQRLLAKQKLLLDAFIQLIAGAIDAKSPYTGGHCQRVPEITLMLAHAAADSDAPEFSSYQPNEEEWEALYIAAWLHDCGKVTTPEYVVDKATKLETIYDRIHEVRMRFEVLKRDAWIHYWKNLAEGGNEAQQARLRDAELNTLDDEFSFIAHTNRGGEAMTAADQARLGEIAKRRWLRTLDDRLGVSWEEEQRLRQRPPLNLPVEELLLDDRPEHLIERPEQELIAPDNPWGFKLNVPQYKFNRGELYNLSIASGTLSTEERYIINHHMVQTIIMLNRLPFPKHLQCVAEIAGGHHEKLDGTGYPKRLTHEQMSLPARMMAIADIFEALTAVDRPYKKGKTLSEAVSIMTSMCEKSHIDPHLFALFIRTNIHKQYAQRFMQLELIDEVDEQSILARVTKVSTQATCKTEQEDASEYRQRIVSLSGRSNAST
jgi:HD-GYP domain-containing protein (c-di-GMP phosphodiesterase class II)